MKLSKKCEYSFLILIELARLHETCEPISAAYLSKKAEVPHKFLEQIMSLLKKNGYVESMRGSMGGYKLTKPPKQINLAEIIRLIDGAIAPIASVSKFFYEQTPSEKNDKLISCFQDIRDYASAKLEGMTLDQFI